MRATRSSRPPMDAGISRGRRSTALVRGVLAAIDSSTTQGQQAIRAHIDDVSVAKMPYQFSTVCTIRDSSPAGNSIIKVEWLPSAVFSLRVWSSSGPSNLDIGLTGYVVSGEYTYVLNSNLGFVGKYSADFDTFVASVDWRKFRILGCSGSFIWSGPQLNKNGTATIARAENSDELALFNPSSKSDFVTLSLDDLITVSAIHDSPTFPFISVDPNDAAIDNSNKPSGALVATSVYVSSSVGTHPGQMPSVAVNPASTTNASFAASVAAAIVGSSTDVVPAITNALNQLNAKYVIYQANGKCTLVSDFSLSFYDMSPGVHPPADWEAWFSQVVSATFAATYTDQYTLSDPTNILPILSAAVDNLLLSNAIPCPPIDPLGMPFNLGMRLHLTFQAQPLGITRGRDIDQSLHPMVYLRDPNFEADRTELFFDPNYQPTVAQFSATNLTLTLTHSVFAEFIVSDTSPFTANTIAMNDASDRTAGMNKQDFVRYQKILGALPPGLQRGQMGKQLQSRGILADIVSVLGPIAGMIFPEALPFVAPANNIANAIESLYI